jgi:enoyl-CoA hydratase/carnithine racemase
MGASIPPPDEEEISAAPVVDRVERNGTLIVRLHRPPVNALGEPLIEGIQTALDEFEAGDARVLIIVSGVTGFFAAGADIKQMVHGDFAHFASYGGRLRGVLERVAHLDRPSIAVLEGRALGGGMELALACTLRVASTATILGLPEAKIGLIPSASATQRLPRFVGRGRALDYMLTGRDIAAEEAYRVGLLDRLVPPGEAEAAALDLARELSARSLPALAAIMRCVDDAQDVPLDEGLAREAARVEVLFPGADAQEGLRAFIEKRPPQFA